MTFSEDVARFAAKVEQRGEAVFVGTVAAVKASIVHGSSVTGAPGQPEATGDLKASWQDARAGDVAHVFTDHPGAPTIEAGTREGRALVLHGSGGGPHSLALTVAAFPKLVDAVATPIANG